MSFKYRKGMCQSSCGQDPHLGGTTLDFQVNPYVKSHGIYINNWKNTALPMSEANRQTT